MTEPTAHVRKIIPTLMPTLTILFLRNPLTEARVPGLLIQKRVCHETKLLLGTPHSSSLSQALNGGSTVLVKALHHDTMLDSTGRHQEQPEALVDTGVSGIGYMLSRCYAQEPVCALYRCDKQKTRT